MIRINKDLCKNCGMCIRTCVKKVFSLKDGQITSDPESGCIECGHCVAVCPEGAIQSDTWRVEEFKPMTDVSIDPEKLIDFLKAKRSVRNFTDQPVTRETVERIIDAGRFAPSDKNTQRRGYVAVTNREIINEMDRAVVDSFRKLLAIVTKPTRKVLGAAMPVVKELDSAVPGIKRLIKASDDGAYPVFYSAPVRDIHIRARRASYRSGHCRRHAALHDDGRPGDGNRQLHYRIRRSQTQGVREVLLKLPAGNVMLTATIFGYPAVKYDKFVVRKNPEITWIE